MSSEPSTALAADTEVEVAVEEAESQAAEIPSLEAGAAPQVVHIPVEGPPLPRTRPAPAAAAESAPEPTDQETPTAPTAVDPEPVRHTVLYALLDAPLWALNRPFHWLSPPARQLIGLLAIATLITSLLALLLLPAAR